MRTTPDRERDDRGSAAVVVAAVVVGLSMCGLLVSTGAAVIASARVAVVADLAALAGATGGEPAAAAVSDANGARLLAFGGAARSVEVEVRLGGQAVRAAAAALPVREPPG